MDHGRGRGQRFVLSVRREKGQGEVRRGAVPLGNKGGEQVWPSSALEGGRGGKQSARRKAIVGLLGDHKSNKKSQYNDFSRKVQFGEINLKQLLVTKTLESVKAFSCATPCSTVGKAFRHVDGQVHYVDTRSYAFTHTGVSYTHSKLLRNNQCLLS